MVGHHDDNDVGQRLAHANAIVNATAPTLYEHALARGEALLAEHGQLVADTGAFTGRSPKDRFIVRDSHSAPHVDWGPVNQPLEPEAFERLLSDMLDAAASRELFVQDLFVNSDPSRQLPVRIVTEQAWHSLFVRNLFITEGAGDVNGRPGWTVLNLPSVKADPARHGTRSDTAIAVDVTRRLVLIANTGYAGEMKKSIFSALNYQLPLDGVLPMHCSANESEQGEVALFFGLSGTGKTTLSADPTRRLIGDDEHGWSDEGVFNFEGGCYAKAIGLSAEAEPQIYAASSRFGAVLENVVLDPVSRSADFDDGSKTENTRVAYPLTFIPNTKPGSRGPHPRDVVFLAADAFGVMPPISRLSVDQAMYHFLSGYTAKIPGTERGVVEPQATFSTCFGSPFMPLPPVTYARMLGERLRAHGSRVWLVNTGWTGGPFGTGRRISLRHTRALLTAALSGALDDVPTRRDEVFGVEVPLAVPGVPDEVLTPRATWHDPSAYDAQAAKLAGMFEANFEPFAAQVEPSVRSAGPRS